MPRVSCPNGSKVDPRSNLDFKPLPSFSFSLSLSVAQMMHIARYDVEGASRSKAGTNLGIYTCATKPVLLHLQYQSSSQDPFLERKAHCGQ